MTQVNKERDALRWPWNIAHSAWNFPSVVFGGGIFFVSLAGLTLALIGIQYPLWAQLVASAFGIGVGGYVVSTHKHREEQ